MVCCCLQESSPAFKIEKEPGERYIMLLDRGPRKQPQHSTAGQRSTVSISCSPAAATLACWHASLAAACCNTLHSFMTLNHEGPGNLPACSASWSDLLILSVLQATTLA